MSDIVVYQQEGRTLMPSIPLNVIKQAYQDKKDFINGILRENVDFGKIPGTDKKTLLKPGAEKMTSFFGLSPDFVDIEKVEDWTGANHNGEPFFYYRVKCNLYHGEWRVASADGSCNSWEKKYRYRKSARKCPSCGGEFIIKGKEEYGGSWLCFKNKGGCGAKFKDGDKAIEGQEAGQIPNPDVAESVNTILKMAQKRALIAATLIATGTSEYFTQDIEDFVDQDEVHADQKPVIVQTHTHVVDVNAPTKIKPLAPSNIAKAVSGQEPHGEMAADELNAQIDNEMETDGNLWHDFAGVNVADMSLDLAIGETEKSGKKYIDLETEELQIAASTMATMVKTRKTPGKKDVSDADVEKYNRKLSAIKAILTNRQAASQSDGQEQLPL